MNKWEWINLISCITVVVGMIFMAGYWVGESKDNPPGNAPLPVCTNTTIDNYLICQR